MVDVFVYSRDAAGAGPLREDLALLEEHWSYMDAFTESMIARGPTFTGDRVSVTGSLHVLGLPSMDDAHAFVADEPNNRAGVYAEHSVWRFENLLGRTMWEFRAATDEPMFLVIARSERGVGDRPVPREALSDGLRERLILYGVLTTLADDEPVGVALAIQAPSEKAVAALVDDASIRAFADVEVHAWEFGGRR